MNQRVRVDAGLSTAAARVLSPLPTLFALLEVRSRV